MLPTQRARKDEQKEERRQDIVAAAWQLFQETSYEAITMAQVADRTGLAKGTLYLYFKTKEELFLAIIDQELGTWFDEVDARLEALETLAPEGERAEQSGGARSCVRAKAQGEDPGQRVAALIVDTLAGREAMIRLLTIMTSVLEKNVSYDVAVSFKLSLLSHLRRTGTLLEKRLPFLPAGEGLRLLLLIYALIIGLRQATDHGPIVCEVHSRPDMADFAIDFTEALRNSLGILILGSARAAGEH